MESDMSSLRETLLLLSDESGLSNADRQTVALGGLEVVAKIAFLAPLKALKVACLAAKGAARGAASQRQMAVLEQIVKDVLNGSPDPDSVLGALECLLDIVPVMVVTKEKLLNWCWVMRVYLSPRVDNFMASEFMRVFVALLRRDIDGVVWKTCSSLVVWLLPRSVYYASLMDQCLQCMEVVGWATARAACEKFRSVDAVDMDAAVLQAVEVHYRLADSCSSKGVVARGAAYLRHAAVLTGEECAVIGRVLGDGPSQVWPSSVTEDLMDVYVRAAPLCAATAKEVTELLTATACIMAKHVPDAALQRQCLMVMGPLCALQPCV
jgi:hypothetical protein